MRDSITLHEHTTDGGAVYLTDTHRFAEAKIIIRLDGGATLIRCKVDND